MSQRRPISFTGMVQPLGGLWHRFAFVLLLFIAFTVMLVGKADILIVNRLKVEIADTAAPILEVLSIMMFLILVYFLVKFGTSSS